MKKLFISSLQSCAGCRMCELSCSFFHEKEVNPELSRITVIKLPLNNLPDIIAEPVFCKRCNLCVKECSVGALSFSRDKWTIELDKDKCIGCGECVEVCRFGAISMHPEFKKPLICDLCGGSPVCVEFCPTGTLVFTEESEYKYKKAVKSIAKRLKDVAYKEEPPPPKWKQKQKINTL